MRLLKTPDVATHHAHHSDGEATAWQTLGLALLILGFGYAQLAAGIEIARLIGTSDTVPAWRELCRWDCGWYITIADHGYHLMPIGHERNDAANWAFWPLFPLTVHLTMWITALNFATAALLVNATACLLLLWSFLHHGQVIIAGLWKRAAFLCLFVTNPFFFYLQVPYTEALFNLFLLLSFIAWSRDKLVLSAAAGAFLTLLRVNGIFWPIALTAMIAVHRRFRIGRIVAQHFWQALAIAAMPVGTLIYMFYMGRHTGDMLAFSHIQIAWDRTFSNPFVLMVRALLSGSDSQLYWLVGGLLALFPLFSLLRQKVYFAIALMLLATFIVSFSTKIESIPRYMWTSIFIYIPFWQYMIRKLSVIHWVIVIIILLSAKFFLIHSWFDGEAWVI